MKTMSIQRYCLPNVPSLEGPRRKKAFCLNLGGLRPPAAPFCNKTPKEAKYPGPAESDDASPDDRAEHCATNRPMRQARSFPFFSIRFLSGFRRRNEWNRFALFGLKKS